MYKKVLFLGFLLSGSPLASSQEFIIKKKNNIKISCAEQLEQALYQTTDQLKSIATIQADVFDIITLMAQDGFFNSASKEQMTKDAQGYEQFNNRQHQISNLMAQQEDFLQSQKKKYAKK